MQANAKLNARQRYVLHGTIQRAHRDVSQLSLLNVEGTNLAVVSGVGMKLILGGQARQCVGMFYNRSDLLTSYA